MTDLESGLALGAQQFSSEDNNKYMIVLTDGVPNVAINYDKFPFSDDVITKTKNKLQEIANSNINLITMLTGIDNEDSYASRFKDGEDNQKTYKSIIEDIFGTTANPTAGSFYYITDDKIQSTISNIYDSLIPQSGSYKDITIVDYFPKEIVNNFDFAYVSNANIGNISASIDKTNNSITWTIPELAVGQTATVQYKLKLKENFDSSIVGKILNTNEKVDITYKDFNNNEQNKTSDITPKLKLTEPPAVLPKAGLKNILIIFMFVIISISVYSLTKLKRD